MEKGERQDSARAAADGTLAQTKRQGCVQGTAGVCEGARTSGSGKRILEKTRGSAGETGKIRRQRPSHHERDGGQPSSRREGDAHAAVLLAARDVSAARSRAGSRSGQAAGAADSGGQDRN